MFSKIIADNFTTFDHFVFDLIENRTDKKAKNMAIIYGENGIGKTSLIKCFEFLKRSSDSLIVTESVGRFFASIKNNGNPETIEKSFLNIWGSAFDDHRVSGYLKKYYKVNANSPMSLTYEIILNKKKYIYSASFDKKSIQNEKLICNGETIFSCLINRLELYPRHFLKEDLNEKLESSFKMYFGEKHTFLSCLHYLRRNISSSFFKAGVSRELLSFLDYLDSVIVVTKEDEYILSRDAIPTYSGDFLNPISNGSYSEKMMEKKKKTEIALSMFFSSLYSSIDSVEYRISTSDSGKQTYHLYFVENKNDEIIRVPFEMESTGTQKMISLFTTLYELVKGKRTIIIDEIDNGINDILLQNIFESLDGLINGQFIVTTHNTLLLRHSIKKYIYLLDRDENNHVISYSLDEFKRKIQAGTDIIGQYLKGLYGGVPQSGAFSMKYIIEAINDE